MSLTETKADKLERLLAEWAKPAGKGEQDRCDNAARMVASAIKKSARLRNYDIRVFAQGSYRNRTNVRKESDVDIAICNMDVVFSDFEFAEGLTKSAAGLSPSGYSYAEFKSDVGMALYEYFGKENVTRGNKAFDIRANSYHVEADAVACFEHRRYLARDRSGRLRWDSGIEIHPDTGGIIINWPEQNYTNGVAKNDATNRRFKALVRILKNLRNLMAEDQVVAADPIPSFFIECLGYNVPNNLLGHSNFTADLRDALVFLYTNTIDKGPSSNWTEVNERKWLFHSSQKWTREQAHAFVLAAWQYVGFE